MIAADFANVAYAAYCVFLYYTGVRRREALRVSAIQFSRDGDALYCDVGKRLKHGPVLAPLKLPADAWHMDKLLQAVEQAKSAGKYVFVWWKGNRETVEKPVFPFCPRTAYTVACRVFAYCHHARLSRITSFFSPHPELGRPQGYSIAEVQNWTGLTLKALNYYIGLAQTGEMGMGMKQRTEPER
jgi:hypothetical protein